MMKKVMFGSLISIAAVIALSGVAMANEAADTAKKEGEKVVQKTGEAVAGATGAVVGAAVGATTGAVTDSFCPDRSR